MSIGTNTASSEQLRSYVERIENIRAAKKQLAQDEAAVKAEAKAAGFTPKAILACVRIRAMKPHDRAESEAMLDMYLHALGMASEPPLFRAAGLMSIDTAVKEQVIARMADFVPPPGAGEIVVNMGGVPVRLFRDKDGVVQTQEVVEKPAPAPGSTTPARAPTPDVPDVDLPGAEQMGRDYAKDNRPVIDNPFPFGDARRARFDAGWRKQTGNDGMGPDEDD
ncbi:DUF2312 domain-containing protein [Ancylobacter sp. IITR112]|uniref:DUF2312 domain-containing protein n=1 Tax=Ancylobacter sp. IITR112 TaxID=3138073 RepID=UPI00352AC97D